MQERMLFTDAERRDEAVDRFADRVTTVHSAERPSTPGA
jgi:hypothetical protein